MKALSLKQPYAELVISGKKKIELRKWNTTFRGKCFIHASKIPDKDAMKKFGCKELPTGMIIGTVEIVGVKHYLSEKEHQADKALHLADSTWGRYGFILKNPIKIQPIPAKGALGFWEYKEKEQQALKSNSSTSLYETFK